MNRDAKAMIQLEGLGKIFYTDDVETHALADVHLQIFKGEYLAIAGPSGCGKSTLLSLLGLLDTPSGGSYELDGQRVEGLSVEERAMLRSEHIGFIFQSFNLIGDLTVEENVELPLTYRKLPSNERKLRVQQALARVEMLHRRQRAQPSDEGEPRLQPDRLPLGEFRRCLWALAVRAREREDEHQQKHAGK